MVTLIAATVSGIAALALTTVLELHAADVPDGKPQEPKPQTKPPEPVKPAETKPEAKGQESKPAPAPSKPEAKGQEPSKPQEGKAQSNTPETKPAPPPPPPAAPPKAEVKPPEAPPKVPGTPIVSIKLALMADPRLFPYEINVDVHGDTAELSGKVGTESEKAAAAEIAQSVEGIKAVTNNLEVVKELPQTVAKRRDEAITQYVKERFARSKTLESAHFEVKTDDGIVSLSGKTKFLVIALEAAEAARQVPGVRAVKTEGIRIEAPE